jgi:hypothetical protein
MVTHRILSLLMLVMVVLSCSRNPEPSIHYRPAKPDPELYDMAYKSGNWTHPDYGTSFESPGNHRIVLEVDDTVSGPVQAVIPWRRPDHDPAAKAMIIVGKESGSPVAKKLVKEISSESCHLAFQPMEGEGVYYVYYLPHRSTGGYYPKLSYLRREEAPEAGEELLLKEGQMDELPHARIVSAQSIDDFHSFFPMEVIATREEVKKYVDENPMPYYLFPEYRHYPIRMNEHLPLHWVMGEIPANGLTDHVKKGEYYTFQVGVWSPENDLEYLHLTFSNLIGDGAIIPSGSITCFNLGGTDLNGKPFQKRLDVPKNHVQALWFGIEVPARIQPGDYAGHVIIHPEGMPADTIFVHLGVGPEKVEEADSDIVQNMSRLKWLNSTIGSDTGFIAKPFIPLTVSGKSIQILGREIELGVLGFPAQFYSWFEPEMTKLGDRKEAMLGGPVELYVKDVRGQSIAWKGSEYSISRESQGLVEWHTTGKGASLSVEVNGSAEYDGMLDYRVALIAHADTEIGDAGLNIPLMADAAEYMLGLGYKGCRRPETVDWKWDVAGRHQEGAWLGAVNKGIQFVLRDENYERPLNTNFYRQKPLNAPPSWYNDGKGGIRVRESGEAVMVENYSGARKMKAGDTLHFNVRFLVTPFKLIDTKSHFTTRFVHRYVPIDSVVAWKGTIVNVHHANEINPYINYPFYNTDLQKAYIDEAHSKGVKVKLYNTIRELTYKAHELFAMRSLGFEIFNDGQGGGHSWLQEHLRNHYHSAWHATSVNDAAILNKGTSRWTNYYIEGINWLAEQQHIDGLYLDDIAFSRTTVKRLANVLQAHRDEVVIDLHSANQFNERDGYINSAFLYMEHMPYITRLWFGEYFEYDLGPDYWLTEVSGIPFGLTGEMLEGGGHPWRGLVYGMTSRIYGKVDPRPLWKLFDDFDIANSEMLGYWVERSPVKTDVANIKSTAYLHPEHVLVAIGSWSDRDEKVQLYIDWGKLGWQLNDVKLFTPAIDGLQAFEELDPTQPIHVESQQGRVVVIERKK